MTSLPEPGIWGYFAANSKVDEIVAPTCVEVLVNFHNAAAFLGADGAVSSVPTAMDILALVQDHGVKLVLSPVSIQ